MEILKRDPMKQQQRDKRQRREGPALEQAFAASPAGRARAAYERGDQLMQFELDGGADGRLVARGRPRTAVRTTRDVLARSPAARRRVSL